MQKLTKNHIEAKRRRSSVITSLPRRRVYFLNKFLLFNTLLRLCIAIGNPRSTNFVSPKKERVIRSTCKILFYVKKGCEKPSGNLPSMYRLTTNGEIEQFGYKKNVPLRSWDVKNNRRRTTSKRRKSILQWTKSAWKYAAVTNNRHKTRYVPSDRQGKTQKKRRYKL